MADAIIQAHGLTKIYSAGPPIGDVVAVDEIELEINSGEIYGLLGPNGAGKSTTIGMLTTRVVPTRGSILIGGVDLVARPALAKQLIGVVPQTNTLDRAMTVFENLEFHGRYFGMSAKNAKALATELLQRVRLIERSKAPVMAMSGGMAQRLMVARAIRSAEPPFARTETAVPYRRTQRRQSSRRAHDGGHRRDRCA